MWARRDLMIANGLLLEVRVLTPGETASAERFGEAFGQNFGSPKGNLPQPSAATLLFQGSHTDNNGSSLNGAANHRAVHGILLIAANGCLSQLAAPHQKVPSLDPAEVEVKEQGPVKIEELKPTLPKPLNYLPVKSARKVVLLKLDDIDWIQSGHNCVTLRVGTQAYVLRTTLDWFERELPSNRFVRISRSRIVQIDRIREFELLGSGDWRVNLRNGTSLSLSRRYRANFQKLGLL